MARRSIWLKLLLLAPGLLGCSLLSGCQSERSISAALPPALLLTVPDLRQIRARNGSVYPRTDVHEIIDALTEYLAGIQH